MPKIRHLESLENGRTYAQLSMDLVKGKTLPSARLG
jgi:hypothetical protein